MSDGLLFVTRKFPPSVGGMETLAETVWKVVHRADPDARLIAYGGRNDLKLVVWMVRTVLRVLVTVVRRRPGLVLVGDALMFAVLAPVLLLLRVPCASMAMGLDLTFPHPVYRAVVLPWVRRAPRLLAISAATAQEAIDRGVPADRVRVVRLGVEVAPPTLSRAEARAAVSARWGLPEDAPLLLTVGRLVRRKGARWFVAEVLPGLPSAHYVLAGAGPEEEAVRAAADEVGVADRVHLLGRVSDDEREELLRGADAFVQPNVAVPGDMEGFGLVTIEAVLRGLPVVAADLEGIKDAVVDGVTGTLLPSGDGPAWVAALTDLVGDRAALAALGDTQQQAALGLYSDTAMAASIATALDLPGLSGSR